MPARVTSRRFCRAHMNEGDQVVLECLKQNRSRHQRACAKVWPSTGGKPIAAGSGIYVLPPAAVATGSTSLAARSGVSSFQRTDPNGRSSMRRTRTGSGPRWKSIAR